VSPAIRKKFVGLTAQRRPVAQGGALGSMLMLDYAAFAGPHNTETEISNAFPS
jgi:hypothetical protein